MKTDLHWDLLGGGPATSVYLTALGMIQNLGINVSPDAIRYLINRNAQPAAEVVKAAAASGKSVDEVNAAVNNTSKPPYTPDSEPQTATSTGLDNDQAVSKGIPDPWDDTPDTFVPDTSLAKELDDTISLEGDPAKVMRQDQVKAEAAWNDFKQKLAQNPTTEENAIKREIKFRAGEVSDLNARIAQSEEIMRTTGNKSWQGVIEVQKADLQRQQLALRDARTRLGES